MISSNSFNTKQLTTSLHQQKVGVITVVVVAVVVVVVLLGVALAVVVVVVVVAIDDGHDSERVIRYRA